VGALTTSGSHAAIVVDGTIVVTSMEDGRKLPLDAASLGAPRAIAWWETASERPRLLVAAGTDLWLADPLGEDPPKKWIVAVQPTSVEVTPNGQYVAMLSEQLPLSIEDLQARQNQGWTARLGPLGPTPRMRWSRTPAWGLAVVGDGSGRLWIAADVRTEPFAPRPFHDAQITDLAWHPTSDRLATIDATGAICIWGPTQQNLLSFHIETTVSPRLAWSPDGRRLAALGSALRVFSAAEPTAQANSLDVP